MRHYEAIAAMYQRTPRGGDPTGTVVLGIDPGPTESAYALVASSYRVEAAAKVDNRQLLAVVIAMRGAVVVESLQSYGMPVGRSVFETAYQIGRILRQGELQGLAVMLYPRQEYARALSGTAKVSDAILKQALELRFGGYGKGEPLALLSNSDKRSAFAVAAYWLDRQNWMGGAAEMAPRQGFSGVHVHDLLSGGPRHPVEGLSCKNGPSGGASGGRRR